MFKSIKEFFVGKPKVEEKPAECPYMAETAPAPEPALAPVPLGTEATIVASAPIVEEIKPETVTISISDNMNVSVGTQSDTITLSPPADPGAWPFPNTVPVEPEVKKTRTPVKQKEAVATKKTTPAITANSKPRKKK